MNALFARIAKEAEIDADLIVDAVFVCNPVMHHLLLGIDPFELGQAPFALATSEALRCARETGPEHPPRARVYILPCIAGHVGADAAAVALSEAPDKSDDLVLVVDVGTNAEILLGNKEKVLACSSPTGPAFEGAQISSGQRAAPGAIERVEIDPVTKVPRFKVIGCDLWSDEDGFDEAIAPRAITGICGSGIIEMVAEMRMAGHRGRARPDRQRRADRHAACFPTGAPIAIWSMTARRRRAQDHRHQPRHPRDPDGQSRALFRRAAADGQIRRRQGGPRRAGRGLRRAYQHQTRDGAGHDPRCATDKVTSAGNAAGTGARIALLNPTRAPRSKQTVRASTRSKPPSSRAFRSISLTPRPFPTRWNPSPSSTAIVALPNVTFNTGGGGAGGAEGARGGRRRRRKTT